MAMLTVKPLEWDENATARTPFGTSYTTHQRADGMFEATVFGSFIGGPYGALEAARAACQADFEHRINSVAALSPDAINALVEAADRFRWLFIADGGDPSALLMHIEDPQAFTEAFAGLSAALSAFDGGRS